MWSCSERRLARAHELAGHGAVDSIDEQGRLAAARNAGDAGEEAERDLGSHILEVVGARARHLDATALFRLAAALGEGDLLEADQILPGERARIGHDLLGRALRHDLTAMDAGTRADIDDIIGQPDRLLVMLDDDHRVADVAQMDERFEEPRIVALMQADRGLVQDIENAGEP